MSESDNNEFGPPWTVLKLIKWSSGFFEEQNLPSPRLDAELLLADALGIDRVKLYMQYDRVLNDEELGEYRAGVQRRSGGEPVAYITGRRGFWTIDLDVDSRVLIPRPETEVVVELALNRIPEDEEMTVVDIGTGSGAIALAIADERPLASVMATDRSTDALDVARHNAERLELTDNVEFFESDLFASVPDDRFPVDVIVSNPPYVADDAEELEPAVREYEPTEALLAGPDGLDVLRRLVPAALQRLKPGGWFFTEIGYDQAEAVRELFAEAGFEDVEVREDYDGNDRVVYGHKA